MNPELRGLSEACEAEVQSVQTNIRSSSTARSELCAIIAVYYCLAEVGKDGRGNGEHVSLADIADDSRPKFCRTGFRD